MNERIRELAEQANVLESEYYDNELEIQKFAELIVKECSRIARATPCPYTDELMRQQLGHTWDMASSEAGREIKEHFGVEKCV